VRHQIDTSRQYLLQEELEVHEAVEARRAVERHEHVYVALKPGGVWFIIEPNVSDKLEENLNPVGRLYYAASTLVCVPNSLAGHGPALGAQAGEARLREVVEQAGFGSFRRATQTPFNLVLEAR